jgi:hypothetical protein
LNSQTRLVYLFRCRVIWFSRIDGLPDYEFHRRTPFFTAGVLDLRSMLTACCWSARTSGHLHIKDCFALSAYPTDTTTFPSWLLPRISSKVNPARRSQRCQNSQSVMAFALGGCLEAQMQNMVGTRKAA